jgi:hypothetical protein
MKLIVTAAAMIVFWLVAGFTMVKLAKFFWYF